MSVEINHDFQLTQTPETNHFLEGLQNDSTEILKLRQELGFKMKGVLAERAREFAEFGFFSRIPTTDNLWDYEVQENDESGELGLVVDTVEVTDGHASGGVVLTPDGVFHEGYASDSPSGKFSFDFEGAREVPLEDYSKYFDKAVGVMKYVVDEETGVHEAEYRAEQARILAAHIQKIDDDNQKYGVGGAEFTGNSKIDENANLFVERIAKMREMVAQGDRKISEEQLENILGHIFAALEYSDSFVYLPKYGAWELVLMAGIMVAPRDEEIGREIYSLTTDMYHTPQGSSYLVRRANRVPYRSSVENERIYHTMAVHQLDRAEKGDRLFSHPDFKDAPSEIVTKPYGTVTSEEIAEWLLNKPVEEPAT